MTSAVIDHQQVTVLFHDHREGIIHYLLQKVRCPDTAQDLSQETYLRLLRQDSVPHADNLTGYLYKTAERLAIDFLRYDKRISHYLSPLDDTLEWECPKPHPETMTILRQQCELLLDAITALPMQCRHVFLLRKIDELSYTQIAEKLAISEKTVQRHLVKAMLHCHRRLGLVSA